METACSMPVAEEHFQFCGLPFHQFFGNLGNIDKNVKTASFFVLNRSLSVELLEWCLQNGANPNMQDKQGNTSLHYHRSEKELATLLNAGANPSIRNKEGRTPLENAVLRGEPETVKALLQEEAAGR